MGNRGMLHDPEGRIRREWRVKRWILCVLEFKRRRRDIMAPGRYTELFFLDEATGLAAGHRPCAECQRTRFNEFRDAWGTANQRDRTSKPPTADEIDHGLHGARLGPSCSKLSFTADLADLPDGVFVATRQRTDLALLIFGDSLLVWSPDGYVERIPRRTGTTVSVLTPRPTVATIQAGFEPQVHPTAMLPGKPRHVRLSPAR
jgi:hypothetical protein